MKQYISVKKEKNICKLLSVDSTWLLKVICDTFFPLLFASIKLNIPVLKTHCSLFPPHILINLCGIDNSKQTAVYVKQTPDTAAAPLGEPVTLQCSLLSQDKETRLQCPVNHRVHWFKAGSGKSSPSVIYTQSNGTDKDVRRSCVYRLSKTLQNSSDAGIYYCAVVTCGEILFGNGTKVETCMYSQSIIKSVLHLYYFEMQTQIIKMLKCYFCIRILLFHL